MQKANVRVDGNSMSVVADSAIDLAVKDVERASSAFCLYTQSRQDDNGPNDSGSKSVFFLFFLLATLSEPEYFGSVRGAHSRRASLSRCTCSSC
jgi:hypothetical protein